MIVLETPETMRAWSLEERGRGLTIGFVPTMGALHEGHASLMREASARDDVAVLSIFVNPAQFGANEDLDKYPRTWQVDLQYAEKTGMAAVYAPSARVMYPEGYSTYVNVEGVTVGLCGKSRPIHFRGVTTVVAKLFNAVLPHRAYFGQKDAQQCAVIKRMARDLDMGVEIVELPTVREADGLAMSSRNAYLSADERVRALSLSRALFAARAAMEAGERDAAKLVAQVTRDLAATDRIDYVELVDEDRFEAVSRVQGAVVLAVAAFVGATRLIDNIKFSTND